MGFLERLITHFFKLLFGRAPFNRRSLFGRGAPLLSRLPRTVWIGVLLCAVLVQAGYTENIEESEVRNFLNRSGFSDISLSEDDIEKLASGKPIYKLIDKMEESSLDSSTDTSRSILERYREIEPNFIVESFFILPVEEGTETEVMNEVQTFLMDVKKFVGIPYWSKEQQKYYDLIGRLDVVEWKDFDDGSRGIVAEQYMKPFMDHEVLYRYWLKEEEFIYTSRNLDPMRHENYQFVKAVKEGNMFTSLFVYKEPGALVCYGLGGVRAFTFFGIFGDRLTASFKGRTRAFFQWFHKEFVEPRLEGGEV